MKPTDFRTSDGLHSPAPQSYSGRRFGSIKRSGTNVIFASTNDSASSGKGTASREGAANGEPETTEWPASTDGVSADPHRVSAGQHKKKRILLIDDEQIIVDSLIPILQIEGYDVTGFTDPDAGLESFLQYQEAIDLVISDQVMPGMSGIQFVEKIRDLGSQVPVILLTGGLTDEFGSRLVELNIGPCFEKPFDPEQLLINIAGRLI